MSNKPLKVRPKGAPIVASIPESPPPKTTSIQKKAGRLKNKFFGALMTQRRRRAAAQFLLIAVFIAVSCFYIGGFGENATAVLSRKRELPIYSVQRADKKISISFDASWGGDKTMRILDILDEYDVKTTFFLVGIWVDKYPDLVKEITSRGHEIGNHSNTHPHMSQLSESQITDELNKLSAKVEKLTGKPTSLFRPPYGDYNDRVILASRAAGYEPIQWSVDSLDWKNRGTADVIKQCTARIEPGDIVLFHNDSESILEALPTVLKHYQGLGLQIVPVSQLILTGNTSIDVQGKQHPAASSHE